MPSSAATAAAVTWVVAGEHDDLDAPLAQRCEGGRGGVLGLVGDADDAGRRAVDGDEYGGRAGATQPVGLLGQDVGIDVLGGEEPGGPDEDPPPLDGAEDARAGRGVEVSHLWQPRGIVQVGSGLVDDGAGERVLGAVLDRGREPQQGVASTIWTHADVVAEMLPCSHGTRSRPMPRTRTGTDKTTPNQNRRVMSRSSWDGPVSAVTTTGSRAMPQMGHAPGPS